MSAEQAEASEGHASALVPFSIDAKHLERQREFSAKTFGPGPRLLGVLNHIRKELDEVEADPQDAKEWADVIILAFDGALRQGHSPQDILDTILNKQTRNELRAWPDWREHSQDEAIEHISGGTIRGPEVAQ